MKKAIMYLLLALGITVGMLLLGGALTGFIAGFMDGYYGNSPGTTSPSTSGLVVGGSVLLVAVICIVLQWVFLHQGFASYSLGNIPVAARWRTVGWLSLAMAGLGIVYCLLYHLGVKDTDIQNDTVATSFQWLKAHPALSLPYLALIESSCNLIIYGAVIRELLTWRHQPALIISIYAALMALLSSSAYGPLMIMPAFLLALIEGWLYEYSRSVVPVIIGDMVFWVLVLALLFRPLSEWLFFPAALAMITGLVMMLRTMEPWKPID